MLRLWGLRRWKHLTAVKCCIGAWVIQQWGKSRKNLSGDITRVASGAFISQLDLYADRIQLRLLRDGHLGSADTTSGGEIFAVYCRCAQVGAVDKLTLHRNLIVVDWCVCLQATMRRKPPARNRCGTNLDYAQGVGDAK